MTSRDNTRPLFVETFWKNPAIAPVSRCIQIAVLALSPVGSAAGGFYVSPATCIWQTKGIYAICLSLLCIRWVYFWATDRAKVLQTFQSLLDSRQFEIRHVGNRYELWRQGRREGYLSLTLLLSLTTLYIVLITLWCFGDFMLQRACAGQLLGHPGVPVVLAGTILFMAILSELLLWGYATRAVWGTQP